MRVAIPTEQFRKALNEDPEFRLAARFWDGSLEFVVGDQPYLLTLADGKVTSIGTEHGRQGSARVIIEAPVEDWVQLLQPIPKPYFHEFFPASMHHNFRLEGDADYLWAYYGAIRRSAEILRSTATVEGAQA